MELKTLWLGLLVSMLAFGVKTGLGWGYMWLRVPAEKRTKATVGVVLLYFLLFSGILALVSEINILAHYEILAPLWRGGITLHWLVALLLILWGLLLLRSDSFPASCCSDKTSKGWLALVIPCPVCLSVILMSLAGLVMYFPENAISATALLFLAFLAVAGFAGLSMILGRGSNPEPVERSLGLGMILMASYFVLTALVMPKFSQVSAIYRLASYSRENELEFGVLGYATPAVMVALLVFGFARARIAMKKENVSGTRSRKG
ncbi:MAG: DUF2162 domain-containing protein [Deltaproteobacteria bacterium]|nr:DUF2162 domain-containing protein [Deltaproteobacteria bacterium]